VVAPVGGIVVGVVNDVIGADRADQSTCGVLQTPVTSAPKPSLAARRTTPPRPPPPMINTLVPAGPDPRRGGPVGPPNRRWEQPPLLEADCGRFRREMVLASGGVLGVGAVAPANTSSPGWNRVTCRPTASTRPATPMPRTGTLGPRSPRVGTTKQIMYGKPVMTCQTPRSRASRMHPRQHLVIAGYRLIDVPQLQHFSLP
jgi:hypothetical protein